MTCSASYSPTRETAIASRPFTVTALSAISRPVVKRWVILLLSMGVGQALFLPSAAALTIGAPELQAAQALGCVLAEDALGYLDEAEFTQRFDSVVDGFDAEQTDVIYAQALGMIDGLLFGISASQPRIAEDRLQEFHSSSRCAVAPRATGFSVSL